MSGPGATGPGSETDGLGRRADGPERRDAPSSAGWAGRDFTWRDGERLVRFGRGVAGETRALLAAERLEPFALLTTPRAAAALPAMAAGATSVAHVPPGPVPEAAAAAEVALLQAAAPSPAALLALGGGRVIDATKAVAAARGLPCAAVPTTLSGAEMSRFHRSLADGRGAAPNLPRLVVADAALSASQPLPALAASAMNAFGHAMEALYVPGAGPVTSLAAVEAARLLAAGLDALRDAAARGAADETGKQGRDQAALGALLAGYAIAATGLGLHHVLCQSIVRTTGASHAGVNAVMAPQVLRFMLAAAPGALSPLVETLAGGDAEAALRRVERLTAMSGATRLGQLGVSDAELPAIAHAALARPELRRSPGAPDEGGVLALLRAAL